MVTARTLQITTVKELYSEGVIKRLNSLLPMLTPLIAIYGRYSREVWK
jgi:hypothetical protein